MCRDQVFFWNSVAEPEMVLASAPLDVFSAYSRNEAHKNLCQLIVQWRRY
jgi:hypothetical protein